MPIAIYLRSAEVKLVESLNAVRDPMGWQAVHFRLDALLEQYKSEYQIKIAVNLINDLLKNYEGGIFLLMDHSIVVMVSELEKAVLSKLIFQLRYLYMDDPLAYTDEGHENPDFCTIYDLSRDWNAFSDMCTKRMALTSRKQTTAPLEQRRVENIARGPVLESHMEMPVARRVVDMPQAAPAESRLGSVVQELQRMDIYPLLRKQPVCSVNPDMMVRRVFDELYVHIPQLRGMLHMDMDYLSNRWLFKYLSHTLDERMLDLVRLNPAQHLSSPVSININVETLLSSAFDQFDAAIRSDMKVSIVFEIPVLDVFADMAAFNLARTQVQKMGYRVCLDGVTAESFLDINRTHLGLDLVKVQWNADADLRSKQNQELAKAVKDCGTNRVILCRCDNRQAVQFGQALGISLFQGRYIDSLLNPAAKVAN